MKVYKLTNLDVGDDPSLENERRIFWVTSISDVNYLRKDMTSSRLEEIDLPRNKGDLVEWLNHNVWK